MSVFGDNSMFNILAGVLAVVIVLIICGVVIVCYYLSKHRDLKGGHQDLIPPIRGSFMNLQEVPEHDDPTTRTTSPKRVARMGINTPMIKNVKGNLHHVSTSSPQAPLTPVSRTCQLSPYLQNPHQLSPALSQLSPALSQLSPALSQSRDQGSYLQPPQQDSRLQSRQPSTPQYLQPEVQCLQQSPQQEFQPPQKSVHQGVQSPQQEVQSPQPEVQYPQQSSSLSPQIHQQSPVQLEQPAHQSQTPRFLLSSVQSPLNSSYQPRRMDLESPYTPVYVDL